jgi:hypothetical protein
MCCYLLFCAVTLPTQPEKRRQMLHRFTSNFGTVSWDNVLVV